MRNQIHQSIEVTISCNGKKISQHDWETNLQIQTRLPNKSEFDFKYRTVYNKVETTGKKYIISVSEKGIDIYELPVQHSL